MFVGRRRLGYGFDGLPQNSDHASEFRKRRTEWRHENDDVADGAEQKPTTSRLRRYSMSDPRFEQIGLLRLLVLYQFDGHDEPLLSDFADME